MRLIVILAAGLSAVLTAGATNVWTNVAHKAFAGELKSIDRKVAVFTNSNGVVTEMPLSALSKETIRRARRQLGVVAVPPVMSATVRQAKLELRRIADLSADGRLKAEEAAERRAAVFRAIRLVAKMKGQPDEVAEAIVKRLAE